jgi:hypothetical protein
LNPNELLSIPEPPRPRGRPTLADQQLLSPKDIEDYYTSVKSIRKTASYFRISPTTVQRYLKHVHKTLGRSPQPFSWKAICRSKVHQWFLSHPFDRLPENLSDIAKITGFDKSILNSYLNRRRNAVLDYLRTLPKPSESIILFTDLDGFKVPSNLIHAYTLDVNKYTCDITLSCVLTTGGQRTIKVPFHIYSEALQGRCKSFPVIGLAKPLTRLHLNF